MDGFEKVFDDSLVATEIADGGGGGTLVFVEGGAIESGGCVAQIGGDVRPLGPPAMEPGERRPCEAEGIELVSGQSA